MTSDAKIGLLLGLVFIFVIAFIINGLPNLRPQPGKADITPIMNPAMDENLGIADGTRRAQDNWTALRNEQQTEQEATQTTAEESSPMTLEPPQTPQAADSPDAPSLLPSIEEMLKRLNFSVTPKETTVVMPAPQPTTTQPPVATERPPMTASPRPRPVESVTPAPDIQRAARSVTAPGKAGWKVYVVGEGESLATVAKKMYGPEEGNRIRNIRRIYEANKDILKSADEVRAGQKLVIPPPLPPLPPKPEDVLSQALFEKVEAIGKPAAAPAKSPAPAAAPAPEVRWYVVQDGDNLWKIAANQLGSGTRYEEIAKLNADLLKSQDTLDVGMRLRLPAK